MFDIRFFQDAKGKCPVIESLDEVPKNLQAKLIVRIERLAELGNELKRPECDYLRDGIYELRCRYMNTQYRLLYFFAGKKIVVLSHIITKEKEVPPAEIDKCITNKKLFEKNPTLHSYQQE